MDPALVTYISAIEQYLGRIADAIEALANLAHEYDVTGADGDSLAPAERETTER